MNRTYPQLEIDLSILRGNAQEVIRRCREQHIRVCGVVVAFRQSISQP